MNPVDWPWQDKTTLQSELALKVEAISVAFTQLAGFQSDREATYWPAFDACAVDAITAKVKAGERASRAATAAVFEVKGDIGALEVQIAFLRLLLGYAS